MSGRRFDLCGRCGVRVKPSYGHPRMCRDCYEVENPPRPRRRSRRRTGHPNIDCPECRYYTGGPCTYHRSSA